MASIKFGFSYGNNALWSAGLYYYENMLSIAKKHLSDRVQFYLLCGREADAATRETLSPYLAGTYRHDEKEAFLKRCDVVFNVQNQHVPVVRWIPDFQHCVLPEMFTSEEIALRNNKFPEDIRHAAVVQLSSRAMREECRQFYPDALEKVSLLPFVVDIPENIYHEHFRRHGIFQKIPERYLYLPNQLWKHKNHQIVFRTAAALKDNSGIELPIVCSGNMHDRRNPSLYDEIIQLLNKLDIAGQVHMLGFVDHADVYRLMRQSVAVINPSLYEGWSTTVEEAKSVGKQMLLSDIPTHREQAPPNARYFPPGDSDALAALLFEVWETGCSGPDADLEVMARNDLAVRAATYADTFCAIVEKAAHGQKQSAHAVQKEIAPIDEIHAQNARAEALYAEGSIPAAHDMLTNILTLKADFQPAHNNLGVICWQMGDRHKALKHLHKACALDPSDAHAAYNLGEILKNLGDFAEAGKVYAAHLLENPDNMQIKTAFDNLYPSPERINRTEKTTPSRPPAGMDTTKQLFVYIDPGFTHDIGHYERMAAPIRCHVQHNNISMLHYVSTGVPQAVCNELQLIPIFKNPACIQVQEKNLSKILEDFESGLTAVKEQLITKYSDHTIRIYMYTAHPAHLPVFAKVFGTITTVKIEAFCNLFHIDRDFCSGLHNIYYAHYLRHIKQEFDRYNQNGLIHISNESQLSASRYEPYLGAQRIIDAQPVMELPEKAAMRKAGTDGRIVLAYAGFPHERVGYPLVFQAYDMIMKTGLAEKVLFKIKHTKKHYTAETLKIYEAFTRRTQSIIHETRFLPGAAYDRFLSESDIILIPYSRKHYPVNTSGMLVDALLRKKVVVVPQGTWMAEQIQHYGVGITFESDNANSFMEAIAKAVTQFPALAENADRNCEAFARKHSAENLFRQIGLSAKCHRQLGTAA